MVKSKVESYDFYIRVNRLIRFLIRRASLIMYVLFSMFFLYSYSQETFFFQQFRNYSMRVITPVMVVMSDGANGIYSIAEKVDSFFGVHDELIRLQRRNKFLEYHYTIYKKIDSENKELRKLLKFSPEPYNKYISARVVGGNNGIFTNTVIAIAGADSGVKKGQIAINGEGVVGKVIEVNATSSRILLITDIRSRVPAITINSRHKTIVAGNNTSRLGLLYLDDDIKLGIGEQVITTGEGDLIPYGLPIGVIKENENGIYLKPYMKVEKLEFVTILN
jgi:rod shape-determining protein MreC